MRCSILNTVSDEDMGVSTDPMPADTLYRPGMPPISEVVRQSITMPLIETPEPWSASSRLALTALIAAGVVVDDDETWFVQIRLTNETVHRLMYAFAWSERKTHRIIKHLIDMDILERVHSSDVFRFNFDDNLYDDGGTFEDWIKERNKDLLPLMQFIKS